MAILIGMEMPTDDMKNIMILADGQVFQFSGYGNPKPLGIAVTIPSHGRLIDADVMKTKMVCSEYWEKVLIEWIDEQKTVIPADEG